MAMMAGRVLLVCALCVLWCGAGGRCDGEDTALVVASPGGRSNDGKSGPGPAPPSPLAIRTSGPGSIVPESEGSQEIIAGTYSEGSGEKNYQDEDGEEESVAEDGENSRHHERLSEQPTQQEVSHEETPEGKGLKERLEEKDVYPPGEEVIKGAQQSQSQQPPPQQLQVQITAPAGREGTTAATGPARPPAPAEPSSRDGSRTIEPTDSRSPSQESHDKSPLLTKTESSAPEPPLKDAFPEQHGQETTTPDSVMSASAGRQARITAPSTSTSDSGEAQSEADGNDAQRPNPNESHDESDSGKTKVPTTLSEAAPQATETVAATQTNHTKTIGDSDSSTAVPRTTSPLLLLLVVACAAAAAVVAA
ncbi:Mucin-associated surface protein (MASP) [Trypanosoma cruzi]|uniref:Mucin-associated surface protein (MASP), putative n=2 Tax=Trypanosoma cruzi TaxID=5693 RepID=Q4E458_TRYCC|nr:mucin-associated surface protein (MASP), putative [Trypanosoma cruzi]EAN99564.1 mucin-associated surface protein (MASP), putative [Trypanosoma cruzi]PWV21280.1 Mucin-associated surface protein (MASP) [Trypanosoma cruzi]RNC43856.1 mucin-associated surface protein (MASP) [Trypanosoma cruzi]|eukprot:XP_821415.1 mucin-associated surface protein (MASP) [Trypanosoma cruzi strain CL Brener]